MKHTETYDFLKNTIVNADVLEALELVPNDSIHLTFTSPPYYNARDYANYSDYTVYLNFLEKVFQETNRITKEGRFLVVNTSPVITPREKRSMSSKRHGIPFDLHSILIQNEWEFIDDIVWVKPNVSVKNRIGNFLQNRKPLTYKPNCVTEFLMVYRKKSDKLLDWNITNYSNEIIEDSKVIDNYETTNVWQINPVRDKVHSAVFPKELADRVIQYYSYKGDIVFDPFGGSGTVAASAKLLDRLFFLTEKEKEYVERMKTKIVSDISDKNPVQYLNLEDFKNLINKKETL
jgi:DNA modification methylase